MHSFFFFHRLIIILCLDYIQTKKKEIQISVLSTEMYLAVYFTDKCFNKRRDWKWSAVITCTDQSISDWQLVWDLACDGANPLFCWLKGVVFLTLSPALPPCSLHYQSARYEVHNDCCDIFRTGLQPKFDATFWMVRSLRSSKTVCLLCSWHWDSSTCKLLFTYYFIFGLPFPAAIRVEVTTRAFPSQILCKT